MSFSDKIKRLFGLDESDAETYDDPVPEQPQQRAPRADVDPATPIQVPARTVQQIFDHVVAEFNTALPGFLASSVDPERQKKHLYDTLDASVREYLASLEAQAAERCRAQWQNERDAQKAETESLKQQARDLESRRSEIKEKQLSAERQKRALQERVHDLETKVFALEAEKEQYEIENKSLINKAKVATVYEKEAEQLQQQLQQMMQESAQSPDLRVGKLNDELAQHRDEISRLKDEIERLKAENAKMAESCETARIKDEMGGAMLNDLQKKASDAIQASKAADARAAELEARAAAAEARAAAAEARVAELEDECRAKDERIAESEETAEAMDSIMEQIDQFEGVKEKLNERIARLREQLEESRKENESLKTTITNNLYIQARQEKAMQEEIDNLRTVSVDRESQQPAVPKAQEMQYPSLFGDDNGMLTERNASDDRTDDLIADSGWIK